MRRNALQDILTGLIHLELLEVQRAAMEVQEAQRFAEGARDANFSARQAGTRCVAHVSLSRATEHGQIKPGQVATPYVLCRTEARAAVR